MNFAFILLTKLSSVRPGKLLGSYISHIYSNLNVIV